MACQNKYTRLMPKARVSASTLPETLVGRFSIQFSFLSVELVRRSLPSQYQGHKEVVPLREHQAPEHLL